MTRAYMPKRMLFSEDRRLADISSTFCSRGVAMTILLTLSIIFAICFVVLFLSKKKKD